MIRLIRHAESTWNAYKDPNRDVPITDKGKEQASLLMGKYDLVICSTMRRTRETLDYSKLEYDKVIFTDLCRERMGGIPSDYYRGEKIVIETEEDLSKRTSEFDRYLRGLLSKYKNIVVISHGVFLHSLTGYRFENGYHMGYSPKN